MSKTRWTMNDLKKLNIPEDRIKVQGKSTSKNSKKASPKDWSFSDIGPDEQSIVIRAVLPRLNQVIDALKISWVFYWKKKRFWTAMTALQVKDLEKVNCPVKIIFEWYCSDRTFDPDNISFAKKYILDGLKKSGIIPDDSWRYCHPGFEDRFFIDRNNPRVKIIIQKRRKAVQKS